MTDMQEIIPFVLTVVVSIAGLRLANWVLLRRRPEMRNEKRFPRQLLMLGLTLVAIVAIALSLPVSISTRNQLVAFIGLVVSGIFAFSSTTLFANLMAGVMMRLTRPFRAGDFIRIGEHFGRVAERGLFDTEIQTETRELISLPNLYLVSHPVSVTRSSGTIVSAEVSLGYDLHHARIDSLLLEAAKSASLEDAFVHVQELGDYSVSYRVNGMLRDTKSLLTARSNLNRAILDTLHADGVEIVSPSFMNQRPQPDSRRYIPKPAPEKTGKPAKSPEEIIFDKAEKAEQRELATLKLQKDIAGLEAALKESPEEKKASLEARLSEAKTSLEAIEKATAEEKE